MRLLEREQLNYLIAPFIRSDTTSVYVLGSLKARSSMSFHPKLSDVDLLVVPTCDSLSDYVSHFEQAIKASKYLNKDEQQDLYEIFLMSSSVANYHYSCLSVFAGARYADERDWLVGKKNIQDLMPVSDALKSELYKAQAKKFREDFATFSPKTDTSKSRKVAKELLRGLKIIICANVDPKELEATEDLLFDVFSFDRIESVFYEIVGVKLKIHSIFDSVLMGDTVDDWSLWVTEQELMAGQLPDLKVKNELDNTSLSEGRFYRTVGDMLRWMLIIGVKDIINEGDDKRRGLMIRSFVDESLSMVVRLAVAGVKPLTNFETDDTPRIVKDAFDIIVDFLKAEDAEVSLMQLTSSIVLLEYAFRQSLESYEKMAQIKEL